MIERYECLDTILITANQTIQNSTFLKDIQTKVYKMYANQKSKINNIPVHRGVYL